MSVSDSRSPVEEGRHHTYVGTRIPWFVHVMWITFWIVAMAYLVNYFVPALSHELIAPP